MSEIVPSNNVSMTFGNREDISALSRRIKAMVPGGDKLKEDEALALAQVSLACQLNPFIGEVWYIPGKGPMVGIRGARRYAKEQIVKEGGADAYYWMDVQPCPPDEAGAEAGDVHSAFKCELYDSVSTTHYTTELTTLINNLRSGGSKDPVGEARQIVGNRPVWVGYGFSTKGESTRMNKLQAARKRAESDAIKRRFDIPFGAGVSEFDTSGESPEVVEGTAVTVKRTPEKIMEEMGVPIVRPYTPEQLKDRLHEIANEHGKAGKLTATAQQRGLLAGQLDECFAPDPTADRIRHSVMKWLAGCDSTKDLPAVYVLAMLDWLEPKKDTGGSYSPSALAIKEANAVWSQALKDAGQTQLPGI